MEADCRSAVDYMQNPSEYQGMDVDTVLECKDFARILKKWITHSFREANSVADSLAKHGYYSTRSPSLWDNSIPDSISEHFVNDLSIIRGIKSFFFQNNNKNTTHPLVVVV